ncbi:hypothetical protein [Deinococcus peraridilitoris]|uniref:Uncharacterized protein n=1 Tax=Deinococcus peraridilitoris (strain DSM 19664 / LMG 22246 / CIP 109416 / KR-200) TaxID=937777 RepID=L0A160_DEIPD|nr:hypothetical protein [Deinococcus peraridilitoris]AFZ67608.1 hypothetical protein Deipe_2118 [Deinococcus peraridilitoris DSM 19664]
MPIRTRPPSFILRVRDTPGGTCLVLLDVRTGEQHEFTSWVALAQFVRSLLRPGLR